LTITRLCVAGYRSLRDVRLELGSLTVVTGANGSGKSSLYRALKLLADVAQGRVIQSRTLRRHAALSPAGRRVAVAATAVADNPE
jgi:predicted ATPase